MQANPVYRNIKNYALKIGCKYTEAWTQYLLMPFHALGDIVATKTIPYVPSGRLIKGVEEKRENALTTEDMSIPESYHLHEAAHVIAEHLFAGSRFTDPREKILKTIVCESFANTVDALACVFATDEVHQFFLQHNCYMHPSKKNVDVMVRLLKNLGPRATFIFTVVAYMHANFLQEEMSSPRLIKELGARYAPEVKVSGKILKDCEALGKIAEKLDPLFRIQTTQMYLKLEGYRGEIYELLDFPFMEVFDANPVFRKAMEAMADVVMD